MFDTYLVYKVYCTYSSPEKPLLWCLIKNHMKSLDANPLKSICDEFIEIYLDHFDNFFCPTQTIGVFWHYLVLLHKTIHIV